jgi:hypothetical protein
MPLQDWNTTSTFKTIPVQDWNTTTTIRPYQFRAGIPLQNHTSSENAQLWVYKTLKIQ